MSKKKKKPVTFINEDGQVVSPDEIGEDIDTMLEETNRLFVTGNDGHRYLVSAAVRFVRSDE